MALRELTLAIDNTTLRKGKGPKIGTRHGDPDWKSAVGLLRLATKAAHQHARQWPRPFRLSQHDDVTACKAYADRVALDLIACSGEIDEPGLHVLHLILRMMWALNNPATRRARAG
jgi:hypothetical protein